MAAERETANMVLRSYRAALDARGLLVQVRAYAEPEVQRVLDSPPLPIGWAPSSVADGLFEALGKALPREQVREVGYQAVRDNIGPVLAPILRGLLSLFGSTPASIFGNMDRVSAIMVRGITFGWEPESPTAGAVVTRNPVPVPEAIFAGWEGAFLFAFDICGVKGTVDRSELLDGGKSARTRLRWG